MTVKIKKENQGDFSIGFVELLKQISRMLCEKIKFPLFKPLCLSVLLLVAEHIPN
jgi:hypothetical protein